MEIKVGQEYETEDGSKVTVSRIGESLDSTCFRSDDGLWRILKDGRLTGVRYGAFHPKNFKGAFPEVKKEPSPQLELFEI